MIRILVIGSGGAGKTTFSRRLGEILSIEVVHLDSRYWKPGWVEPEKSEWASTVEGIVERDAWVIEGDYSRTLERLLAACDAVVFLDFPRLTCIWRVLKRVVTHFNTIRSDMADGGPERFSLQFLLRIWNYPKRSRPKILKLLDEHKPFKTVVWLQSSGQVERFLAHAENAEQGAAGDTPNACA